MSIASHNKYDHVVEILRRGNSEELIIADLNEAQVIIDSVRVKLLDIQLKYPNWDYELPNYNEGHEEVFQQFQMGAFEKTVLYVSQEFEVRAMI